MQHNCQVKLPNYFFRAPSLSDSGDCPLFAETYLVIRLQAWMIILSVLSNICKYVDKLFSQIHLECLSLIMVKVEAWPWDLLKCLIALVFNEPKVVYIDWLQKCQQQPIKRRGFTSDLFDGDSWFVKQLHNQYLF